MATNLGNSLIMPPVTVEIPMAAALPMAAAPVAYAIMPPVTVEIPMPSGAGVPAPPPNAAAPAAQVPSGSD
jgi:hypothetical protein